MESGMFPSDPGSVPWEAVVMCARGIGTLVVFSPACATRLMTFSRSLICKTPEGLTPESLPPLAQHLTPS